MKGKGRQRSTIAASLLGAVLFWVPTMAYAQCSFDGPAKAKGLKADLVRAYAACPGVTFAAPNTATMAGVPGCTPPTPLSEFLFDDRKGRCSIKWRQKIERPCSTGTGVDCSNLSIDVTCRGVTDAGGDPIESGVWSLHVVRRSTLADASAGDLTVIDFPAQFFFDPPGRGKISLRVDYECGSRPQISSSTCSWRFPFLQVSTGYPVLHLRL